MNDSDGHYFIDECKKKMVRIHDHGFILSEEKHGDKWSCLAWESDGIRILVGYSSYGSEMDVFIDLNGQHADLTRLYDHLGIPNKHYCRCNRSGMEKCIDELTGGILDLLNRSGLKDHAALADALETSLVQKDAVERYFISEADQYYLSGDYQRARQLYKQYEYALNDKQLRRLKRIEKISG